jgi:hypothetical protein
MNAPRNPQTVSSDTRQSWRGATGTLNVPIESVALARLIEEVGGHAGVTLSGYNRTYHRHNR